MSIRPVSAGWIIALVILLLCAFAFSGVEWWQRQRHAEIEASLEKTLTDYISRVKLVPDPEFKYRLAAATEKATHVFTLKYPRPDPGLDHFRLWTLTATSIDPKGEDASFEFLIRISLERRLLVPQTEILVSTPQRLHPSLQWLLDDALRAEHLLFGVNRIQE